MIKKYDTDSPFSVRQLRVGEEIRRLLSALFMRTSFRDPRLWDVDITITEVQMTPDLKMARVYFMNLGQNNGHDLEPAMENIASWVRRKLAGKLRLRYVPRLIFKVDETLQKAEHMDALLNSPDVQRDLK